LLTQGKATIPPPFPPPPFHQGWDASIEEFREVWHHLYAWVEKDEGFFLMKQTFILEVQRLDFQTTTLT